MKPIDNEKIGQFIAAQRKALGLTQKELAQQLFVSDKTVSKWERGASLPNVALLQPLAEVLQVGVDELLNGERRAHESDSADSAAANALRLSLQESLRHQRHIWALIYASAAAVLVLEAALLFFFSGTVYPLWLSALLMLFAAWLCFFAKPWLPAYYDSNRIHFIQQGPFRINMVGLRFNNSNWPPLLTVFRCGTLGFALLYPLGLLAAARWPMTSILPLKILGTVLACLFIIAAYAIGKKYE